MATKSPWREGKSTETRNTTPLSAVKTNTCVLIFVSTCVLSFVTTTLNVTTLSTFNSPVLLARLQTTVVDLPSLHASVRQAAVGEKTNTFPLPLPLRDTDTGERLSRQGAAVAVSVMRRAVASPFRETEASGRRSPRDAAVGVKQKTAVLPFRETQASGRRSPRDAAVSVKQRTAVLPLRETHATGRRSPRDPAVSVKQRTAVLPLRETQATGRRSPRRAAVSVKQRTAVLPSRKTETSGRRSPRDPAVSVKQRTAVLPLRETQATGRRSPRRAAVSVKQRTAVLPSRKTETSGRRSPRDAAVSVKQRTAVLPLRETQTTGRRSPRDPAASVKQRTAVLPLRETQATGRRSPRDPAVSVKQKTAVLRLRKTKATGRRSPRDAAVSLKQRTAVLPSRETQATGRRSPRNPVNSVKPRTESLSFHAAENVRRLMATAKRNAKASSTLARQAESADKAVSGLDSQEAAEKGHPEKSWTGGHSGESEAGSVEQGRPKFEFFAGGKLEVEGASENNVKGEAVDKNRHIGDVADKDRHKDEDVNKDRHIGDDVNTDRHKGEDVDKDRHKGEDVDKGRHKGEDVDKDRHIGENVDKDKHISEDVDEERHIDKDVDIDRHKGENVSKETLSAEDVNKDRHKDEDVDTDRHNSVDINKERHNAEDVNKNRHKDDDIDTDRRKGEDVDKDRHKDEDIDTDRRKGEDVDKDRHKIEDVDTDIHNGEDVDKDRHKDGEDVNKDRHDGKDAHKGKSKGVCLKKDNHQTEGVKKMKPKEEFGKNASPKSDDTKEGKPATPPKHAPANSSEAERRLKFQRALHWAGAPLVKGRPQWQMVDNNFTAFVYSAHYDDVDSPARVRVVGIAQEFLPFINVTCRYYGRLLGPSVHSVSGRLYHFQGTHDRRYIGAYVDCPLPKGENSLPFAVSVDKGDECLGNNYMVIHYSHGQSWLQEHHVNFSDNVNEEPTGKENSHKKKSGGDENRRRWNITRCFPAFQKQFNEHVLLAEMVAASTAFGVQRFVFYVESAGPEVLKMLKVLENEGLAEVHPWNLHLYGMDLFYVAQFSAIQDCLYRHLWSSKYLLFGDVDELFVPRKRPTLMPLLQTVFDKNPECGAFLFRNTFYNLHIAAQSLPPSVDPSGYALKHQLPMLTHVRREKKVWSPGSRSKPAVDPRKVDTGSVHVVQKLRKGFKNCSMDSDLGLLHHYRHWERPAQEFLTDDTYLWKFAAVMVEQVRRLYQKFNETTDHAYP